MIFKYFIILVLIVYSLFANAQKKEKINEITSEEKFSSSTNQEKFELGVNLFSNYGYTSFFNFKREGVERDFKYEGSNYGLNLLYSLINFEYGAPVVGIGYVVTEAKYKTDTMKIYSIVTYAGLKFSYFEELNLFALINFGYSLVAGSVGYINGVLVTTPINNHYRYGFNFIASYNVFYGLSIDIMTSINFHKFTTTSIGQTFNWDFLEFSPNVGLSYYL